MDDGNTFLIFYPKQNGVRIIAEGKLKDVIFIWKAVNDP